MQTNYMIYVDKLEGEYREVFEAVNLYVGTITTIAPETINERMLDFLDILLSAQEEKKPVKSIVGNDVRIFCQDFFANIGFMGVLQHFLSIVKIFAWWILGVSIIDVLYEVTMIETTKEFFAINATSLPLGSMMCFPIIVIGHVTASYVIRQFMLRKKDINIRKYKIIQAVEAIIIIVAAGTAAVRSRELVMIDIKLWVALFSSGVFLLLYYVFNRKWRLENRISFWDSVKESVTVEDLDKELMKRFNKENKKRLKKGKEEESFESFVDKMEKEWNKTEQWMKFMELFMIAIMLVIELPSLIVGEVQILEFVLYTFGFIVFACFAGNLYRKIVRTSMSFRLEWLKQKREEILKIEMDNLV